MTRKTRSSVPVLVTLVMLNPAFRDVGIGIASGVPRPLPPGGATYTADFGVRR
jgi:hypothetical protein